MFHSIRLRLLLTVGVVVATSLFAVGLLASRATRKEFAHYTTVAIRVEPGRLPPGATRLLEEHFRVYGNWKGTGGILNSILAGQEDLLEVVILDSTGHVAGISDSELLAGSGIMKLDSLGLSDVPISGPGYIRLDSLGESGTLGSERRILRRRFVRPGSDATRWRPWQPGTTSRRETSRQGASATVLQNDAGDTVGRLVLVPLPASEQASARDFLHSVNRWILALVLGAGLIALLFTALVARRILHPVEELTQIARGMARGDLSRRATVRSRDEIGELGHAFNAMADGLARIEMLRHNMVQDAAHELRTPVTGIRCQLEAMRDGLMQPDRATIDSLHEEILALGNLVEALQDLALAEAGQLRLSIQPVALHPEVERAVRAVAAIGDRRHPSIRIEIPADLPPVHADPERLGQILRNLLSNALTHTAPEGMVRVTASLVAPQVEISIVDTGSGIAPEEIPFLFERFYRADPSRQRLTGGVGLGLAICRQLVEAQGGTIRAESTPGKGATFRFTLPLANHERAE